MSISFTAHIKASTAWFGEGELTEPFIAFESVLDLGSSRVLRTIIKKSDDCCGTIDLTYEDAITWLAVAYSKQNYALIGAGLNYLMTLRQYNTNDDDSINKITVTVNWA